MRYSATEEQFLAQLEGKYQELARYLAEAQSIRASDPEEWLHILSKIKAILGNTSNDLSAIACILARDFITRHLGVAEFDSLKKPQGASGPDVDALTRDGERVLGEIKTTAPYNVVDFGANQRKEILKDLERLRAAHAEHKLFFVTDRSAFDVLMRKYASHLDGIVLVHLPSLKKWDSSCPSVEGSCGTSSTEVGNE